MLPKIFLNWEFLLTYSKHSTALIMRSRLEEYHCVKTIFIRSFSGAYFPALWPEKLRIRAFFRQCTRLEEITFNGLDTISPVENSSLNAATFDAILFAYEANLFLLARRYKYSFLKPKWRTKKIEQWFKANKLSLNIKKTKHTLFHKNSSKDDIPLKLPDLKIENLNMRENLP